MPEFQTVSVKFTDMSFENFGAVTFGVHDEPDVKEDGTAIAINRTFSVSVDFDSATFAETESQLRKIRSALSRLEGELLIKDEAGRTLYKHQVSVVDYDVPEDWRQFSGRLTAKFLARRIHPQRQLAGLILTAPGGTAVRLTGVRSHSEALSNEYYDEDNTKLRRRIVQISMSGRHYANPETSRADRRAELVAMRQQIEAAALEPGLTMVWAGESRDIQPENLTADFPGDTSDYLDWSLQAMRIVKPSGTYVECRYRITEDDDEREGIERFTISGTIRADDKTTAMAKAAKLKAHYGTGREYIGGSTDEERVVDLASDDIQGTCIEIAFTYRFETPTAASSWEYTVSTRDDHASGDKRVVYAGTVKGAFLAAANKAADLGDNKFPDKVRSELVYSYEKRVNSNARALSVQFTYEYRRPATLKYVDLTVAESDEHFSSDQIRVSGTVTGADRATAAAFAATFKQSGLLIDAENLTERQSGPEGKVGFVSLQVDYRYFKKKAASRLAVDYGVSTENDYLSQGDGKSVTVSGVVYGGSRNACKLKARQVAREEANAEGIPSTRNPSRDTFTPRFKREGTITVLEGYEFQIQWRSAADNPNNGGEEDDDAAEQIRTAEFSASYGYQHQRVVVTPIPGKDAQPHVQTDLGYAPGSISVSGSVASKTLAKARTWARDKINKGKKGAAYFSQNPVITERTVYSDEEGKVVSLYVVDFSAAWVVTGMTW